MLKRLCLAFAGLFALVTVAQGAGTVPGFSLTPQFDLTGKVAPGCKLFIIQAGTSSNPQNAYQDTGLTLLLPNPLTCDAAGRLPQWFVADGTIKLRLTDKNGLQLFTGDNLLVIGPSSGGGGGGTVDPTTVLATGDIKDVYGTGVLTGFVRANGRTIGSSTSGATERANADTSALFAFLWGQDPNLVVSGGRGVSAAADFAANKTIAVPDFRSRVRASLSDMGNVDSTLFSSPYCANPTTLGTQCGGQTVTLTLPQLPTGITSTASPSLSVSTTLNNFVASNSVDGTLVSGSGSGNTANVSINIGPTVSKLGATGTATGTVTSTSSNTSGAPHRTVQPTILITTYIKL